MIEEFSITTKAVRCVGKSYFLTFSTKVSDISGGPDMSE